ncbi:hypothetical protein JCM5353_003836 [Sporobolomyces roseus]
MPSSIPPHGDSNDLAVYSKGSYPFSTALSILQDPKQLILLHSRVVSCEPGAPTPPYTSFYTVTDALPLPFIGRFVCYQPRTSYKVSFIETARGINSYAEAGAGVIAKSTWTVEQDGRIKERGEFEAPWWVKCHEEWGKREMKEQEETERDSISIYGLEEILRLSLCPPHLFPDDSSNTQDYSHFPTPSASNRTSLTPSDESVSLSLFDDESICYNTPSKVHYPHQPIVHSSAPLSARSRSHTVSTTRSTPRLESEDDGFSFCPTPSSSNLATPVSTPARSIFERDVISPSTPGVDSQTLDASPSSLLFLPPS